MSGKNIIESISQVSKDFTDEIKNSRSLLKRQERGRKRREMRRLRKRQAKIEGELAIKERQIKVENAAMMYADEKKKNSELRKEVESLKKQVNFRKYVEKKGFQHVKGEHSHSEYLFLKLPACMKINPELVSIKRQQIGEGSFGTVLLGRLNHLNINVAVKKSKGSSLLLEAGISQALSGHEFFLSFFGMMENAIVTELITSYNKHRMLWVSSTLDYFMRNSKSSADTWLRICAGIREGIMIMHEMEILHNDIKENNILISEKEGKVCPKIFDFGKCTHTAYPLTYNLSASQKAVYNRQHRHLAHELRVLNGYKQSRKTDAYSVGRIFKQIGGVSNLQIIIDVAKLLKNNNPVDRVLLKDVSLNGM